MPTSSSSRTNPAAPTCSSSCSARTCALQYDPHGDEKDTSRAYVFLPDGTLVNAEMLRKGLARVDASRPFAHQEEFERLEKEAQASGLGIWTTSPK